MGAPSTDGRGGSSSMADAVVADIKALGGEAVANYDSVSTPEGGEAIVQAALNQWGRLDVVINNAGMGTGAQRRQGRVSGQGPTKTSGSSTEGVVWAP